MQLATIGTRTRPTLDANETRIVCSTADILVRLASYCDESDRLRISDAAELLDELAGRFGVQGRDENEHGAE